MTMDPFLFYRAMESCPDVRVTGIEPKQSYHQLKSDLRRPMALQSHGLGPLLRPLKHFEGVVEGLLGHIIETCAQIVGVLTEFAYEVGLEAEAKLNAFYRGFQDHFAHDLSLLGDGYHRFIIASIFSKYFRLIWYYHGAIGERAEAAG